MTCSVDRRRRRSATVSYRTAHQRVCTDRGNAAEHTCTACGGQAADWAYDGTDPAELVGFDNFCRYSLDVSRYQPMCTACHVADDAEHRRRPDAPSDPADPRDLDALDALDPGPRSVLDVKWRMHWGSDRAGRVLRAWRAERVFSWHTRAAA